MSDFAKEKEDVDRDFKNIKSHIEKMQLILDKENDWKYWELVLEVRDLANLVEALKQDVLNITNNDGKGSSIFEWVEKDES